LSEVFEGKEAKKGLAQKTRLDLPDFILERLKFGIKASFRGNYGIDDESHI